MNLFFDADVYSSLFLKKIMDVREVSCLSAIVFAKFEERFQ